MSTITVLYVGNDNILEVCHVRNELTGDFINDATVEVSLFDVAGEEVAGGTWPKSLVYVTDSKGVYRTMLPAVLTLLPNARYVAEVEATAAGTVGKWTLNCVARVRD